MRTRAAGGATGILLLLACASGCVVVPGKCGDGVGRRFGDDTWQIDYVIELPSIPAAGKNSRVFALADMPDEVMVLYIAMPSAAADAPECRSIAIDCTMTDSTGWKAISWRGCTGREWVVRWSEHARGLAYLDPADGMSTGLTAHERERYTLQIDVEGPAACVYAITPVFVVRHRPRVFYTW